MPVGAEFLAFVFDLLAPLCRAVQRMFGGVGIMRDGAMFALFLRNTMCSCVGDRTRLRLQAAGGTVFTCNCAGRAVHIESYNTVTEMPYDQSDILVGWGCDAMAAAPPASSRQRRAARRTATRRAARL
ncbi:MAG: TfoX/Sxy family protein [Rhodospirillales bacterium]|jgi:TfoX/Sxy family transcriptional regulator of competence genes|nr:TfoX/Sxy family protein [Rhodospirillales bacterium]